MKNKILLCLLSAGLSLAQCVTAHAQSPGIPNPSDVLTNVPSASSFTNATLEVSVGAVMHGSSSFENSLSLRYNIGKTFFAGGEIQNGPASSVVDSAGLFVGVRKAFDTAEVYGQIGGRRTWISSPDGRPAWECLVGGGAAWRPVQGDGVLSKFALFTEVFFVGSQHSMRPEAETRAGVRYLF